MHMPRTLLATPVTYPPPHPTPNPQVQLHGSGVTLMLRHLSFHNWLRGAFSLAPGYDILTPGPPPGQGEVPPLVLAQDVFVVAGKQPRLVLGVTPPGLGSAGACPLGLASPRVIHTT